MGKTPRLPVESGLLKFAPPLAPAVGRLLVAAPNMGDGHFRKRVLLMCDYSPEGSFALILNQPLPMHLAEAVARHKSDLILHGGGPVQDDTVHFIHCRSDVKLGSREIAPGIFWGGNFEKALRLVEKGVLGDNDIRFFVGYSGWSPGQLQDEMKKVSWFVAPVKKEFLFYPCRPGAEADLWEKVLLSLGPKYGILFDYPLDPHLN